MAPIAATRFVHAQCVAPSWARFLESQTQHRLAQARAIVAAAVAAVSVGGALALLGHPLIASALAMTIVGSTVAIMVARRPTVNAIELFQELAGVDAIERPPRDAQRSAVVIRGPWPERSGGSPST